MSKIKLDPDHIITDKDTKPKPLYKPENRPIPTELELVDIEPNPEKGAFKFGNWLRVIWAYITHDMLAKLGVEESNLTAAKKTMLYVLIAMVLIIIIRLIF